VIRKKSGLTSRTKYLKTPRLAFDFFMTNDIKEDIMKHTNERIEEYQAKRSGAGKPLRSEHKLLTDMRELDAFIGIQIYR
jgi:hypothetical protein